MTPVNPALDYALTLCGDRKALAYILGYPSTRELPSYGERVTVMPWGLRLELLSRAAACVRGGYCRLYIQCPVCWQWVTPGRLPKHVTSKHVDTPDTKRYLDSRIGPDRTVRTLENVYEQGNDSGGEAAC